MAMIFTMLTLGQNDALTLDRPYPGLPAYRIEQMLDGLIVGNETVSDNIAKLVRLTFLHQISYTRENRHGLIRYFLCNPERFPCYLGMYVIHCSDAHGTALSFVESCPYHIQCNLHPESCRLPAVIVERIRSMLAPDRFSGTSETFPFIDALIRRLQEWQADETRLTEYQHTLETYCNQHRELGIVADQLAKLIQEEILFYGKWITLRPEDGPEIGETIRSVLNIKDASGKSIPKSTTPIENEALKNQIKKEMLQFFLYEPEQSFSFKEMVTRARQKFE
jgi:hypothetical protein